MTNANMQLVVVSVLFDDKLETPEPKLDPGEYIVTKVVELSKLSLELEGESRFL
jgi:ADP-ribose pyrophosphatase